MTLTPTSGCSTPSLMVGKHETLGITFYHSVSVLKLVNKSQQVGARTVFGFCKQSLMDVCLKFIIRISYILSDALYEYEFGETFPPSRLGCQAEEEDGPE